MPNLQNQKLRDIVTELLFLFDPAGLNDICPEDEYALEAHMILNQPELFESEERLRGGIYAVFMACMGARNIAPAEDPVYARLAKEIMFAKEVVVDSAA